MGLSISSIEPMENLLSATPFTKKNTMTGVDAGGRPMVTDALKLTPDGTLICPAL